LLDFIIWIFVLNDFTSELSKVQLAHVFDLLDDAD